MALQNTKKYISESFNVIWLDPKVNQHQAEHQHLTERLQRFVNSVKTFFDADYCIDYLTDLENEKVFLIVSYTLAQQLVFLVKDIVQVYSIYILSDEQTAQKLWINDCYKVKGVFSSIEGLRTCLEKDICQADMNFTPISVVSVPSCVDLNQLDPSFMYSKLLKEILLKMEYDKKAMDEFIEFCLIKQVENESAHRVIDEFEQTYDPSQAVRWYTRDCFIYPMLNQALRDQDIHIINKMGFFIRDLHRQIEQLHSHPDNEKPLKVYRGQGMFNAQFDTLHENIGGLLSFNNFLSTSTDKDIALARAVSAQEDPKLTGVLFRIEIDSSISTTPYASLDKVSYFFDLEKEILFSMHTVFRIGGIEKIEQRLWEVKLTLTSDTDEDLNRLTIYMREEISGQTPCGQLANLMVKMSEFNKAEETYKAMLKSASDNVPINNACLHNNIGYIMTQKNDLNTALSHLKQGLEIKQRHLPSDHPDLAASHNNIGDLYQSRGEFADALFHHEKALEIWQKCLPPNHPKLSLSYNNIGEVYRSMGKVSDALLHHKKALKIRLETLPPTHPDLAMSYNNIGLVYQLKGEYKIALSHLKKALEIMQKSLPSNHPGLATVYNNIGESHLSMHEYEAALSNHRKAIEIQEKSFPPTHPDLATSHNHIGMVHHMKGEYSTALRHYEKAIEIFQISLPPNHPDLARSYSNVGLLYHSIGEYSSALSHYKAAFKICQASLPPDSLELMILPLMIAAVSNINSLSSYDETMQLCLPVRSNGSRTFQPGHPQTRILEDELD